MECLLFLFCSLFVDSMSKTVKSQTPTKYTRTLAISVDKCYNLCTSIDHVHQAWWDVCRDSATAMSNGNKRVLLTNRNN